MLSVRSIFIFVCWIFIIALSIYFFSTNVAIYFTGFRSKIFGETFFNNQFWVVIHLIGGTLALFLGPVQFWRSFRDRYLEVHRLTGKVYMIGVGLIVISALRLSLISFCEPCRVSLFILALLALISTAFAWKAVKAKNIKAHRQFMVRSFICVFSFVAVRIDDIFSLSFFFGVVEDPTFRRVINEYFFSFVPLLVGEIIMVWVPSVSHSFANRK